MRNDEHERKRDGTTNHAAVSDECEFTTGDGLLLKTQPKEVKGCEDAENSAEDNDRQLSCDPLPTPPSWDCVVQRYADVGVDCGLRCVAKECVSHTTGLFALR